MANCHFKGFIREDGVLKTSSSRDDPLLADGMGSIGILRGRNRKLEIVGVKNKQKEKAKVFGLPGGRRKHLVGENVVEKLTDTALNEVWEEAGVKLKEEDIFPVTRVIKYESHLRDENDKDTGRGGYVDQFIFAHFGDVELQETTDKDIEYACWISIEDIVENPSMWFESHIPVIIQSLRIISMRFDEYIKGDILQDEIDFGFYQRLARAINEGEVDQDEIDKLYNLNVFDVLGRIDRFNGKKCVELIRLFLAKFEFEFFDLYLPTPKYKA